MTNAFPALGRQAATRQTYEQTGGRLAKRLSIRSGSTDPAELVAEFLVSARNLSQGTFRLYKAALLQHLESNGVAPSVLNILTNASSKDCAKTSNKTSGRKAKSVNSEDQALLIATLRARRSQPSQLAADYFHAGLIVGPRPVEWTGAQLVVITDDKPIDAPATATHAITLQNAKRDDSGVRGNGATRTLYLSLNAPDAAAITRVVHDARIHQLDWASHYQSMRNALRYAAKSLWPRRISRKWPEEKAKIEVLASPSQAGLRHRQPIGRLALSVRPAAENGD